MIKNDDENADVTYRLKFVTRL